MNKILILLTFVIAALPSVSQAGYLNILSEFTSSPSIIGSREINLNSFGVSNILIDVRVNAQAGNQLGNYEGYTGDADVYIHSFVNSITNANGAGIGIALQNDVVKNGSGDWSIDGTTVPSTLFSGASADVIGNNAQGIGSIDISVYWIDPTFGNINVSSSIPSANWTITGPETITDSGSLGTYTNKRTGTYTITWGAVDGYNPPASTSFTLTAGGTLNFPQGNYTAIPSVNLNFAP